MSLFKRIKVKKYLFHYIIDGVKYTCRMMASVDGSKITLRKLTDGTNEVIINNFMVLKETLEELKK